MTSPQRSSYEVVIIGGGVIGLFTAHFLSQHMDPGKILVVDRGFATGGASGRNGGGVRQQWETRATIRLARESVEFYRRFGRDFGYNPWFRQGGYLFLAFTEEEVITLRRMETGVRSEGLPIRYLEPSSVLDVVPDLDVRSVRGATYLASDGVILPFPVVWGLLASLKERGVEVLYRTAVRAIDSDVHQVRAISTEGGRISTPKVVNAAGGWSREINLMAGVPTITHPTLHEILATEPLTPFLDPMVVTLSRGTYFSQTMRGEVVGGLTMDHSRSTRTGLYSSREFLVEMSKELNRLVPRLAEARILRAWSGYYDDSPDGLPLLGEDPKLGGFFHANGFGGHGFMLAPSATRRVAQMVLGQKTDLDPAWISPARFSKPGEARTVEGLSLG